MKTRHGRNPATNALIYMPGCTIWTSPSLFYFQSSPSFTFNRFTFLIVTSSPYFNAGNYTIVIWNYL